MLMGTLQPPRVNLVIQAEKLKAFISRTTDLCRRKYGRGTERIPRRSVFWGTANKSPLNDRTGSTRYCLIDLPDKKLPLKRVQLERDAFWRRAVAAYRENFQSFSTDSELKEITSRNSCYDAQDPWAPQIAEYIHSRRTSAYIRIDDIYRHLDIAAQNQNTDNANRISDCMAEVGWVKARRRIGTERSGRVWAFFPDKVDKVPPVEELPPTSEEEKLRRWNYGMRKYANKTADEP